MSLSGVYRTNAATMRLCDVGETFASNFAF